MTLSLHVTFSDIIISNDSPLLVPVHVVVVVVAVAVGAALLLPGAGVADPHDLHPGVAAAQRAAVDRHWLPAFSSTPHSLTHSLSHCSLLEKRKPWTK
jgi:hypothetical protein